MKKEYFNLPNMLGYIRIFLLPVFLYLYRTADSSRELATAFLLLALSLLTDLVDGWIARRFNMITDWGKVLDPFADKLTQGILAIAVIDKHPLMLYFVILFVIKEAYMTVVGYYLKKTRNICDGAKMHGKITTCVVDAGVFSLLLFPKLSRDVGIIIILVLAAFVIYSWIRYIAQHRAAFLER